MEGDKNLKHTVKNATWNVNGQLFFILGAIRKLRKHVFDYF